MPVVICPECSKEYEITKEKLTQVGLGRSSPLCEDCKDKQIMNLLEVGSTDSAISQDQGREKILECYHRIIAQMKRYLDMPEDHYKFISLWVIGTYFHKNFYTYPFLFFNAMRGSGKTRTLKVISALGAKGDGSVQNNISEAVLFRIAPGTTTCIDEIEGIGSKEKSTMRELLNAAYKKGVKVRRMKKTVVNKEEKYIVEEFQPYFPIALANIKGIEEVLGDRSITLILEKSSKSNVTKKIEDFDQNPEFEYIKRTLERFSDVCDVTLREKNIIREWNGYIDTLHSEETPQTSHTQHTTQTTHNTITSLDPSLLPFFEKINKSHIEGRNFELLHPILTIAQLLDEQVFDEILKICSNLVHEKKADELSDSKDVMLYEFVSKQEFYRYNAVLVKELTAKFRSFTGEDDDEDRWLNEKWMGRALKRLNLVTSKKKVNVGRQVTLNVDKAKEKLKIFKNIESEAEDGKD